MKGVTWTQAAQYTVLILAYLIPGVALAYLLTGNPIPQLAFALSDISERINQIQTDLGFGEYTAPFQSKPMLDVLAITGALMVGTAGLPHVIIRFYTTPDVRSARYSAFWALLFIGLLYTTAPALAMFARYNLISTLHNKPIERGAPDRLGRQMGADGAAEDCRQERRRHRASREGQGVPREGRQARLQRARYDEPERGVSGQRHHRAVDA
jgi:Na+(H+)/acetate symporter ActP